MEAEIEDKNDFIPEIKIIVAVGVIASLLLLLMK